MRWATVGLESTLLSCLLLDMIILAQVEAQSVQPHLYYMFLLWARENRGKKRHYQGRCLQPESCPCRCFMNRPMGQVEAKITPVNETSSFLLEKWSHNYPSAWRSSTQGCRAWRSTECGWLGHQVILGSPCDSGQFLVCPRSAGMRYA